MNNIKLNTIKNNIDQFQFKNDLIFKLAIIFLGLIFTIFTVHIVSIWYSSYELATMYTSDGPYQTARLLSMINKDSTHSMSFYNYGNFQHFISFYVYKLFIVLGASKNFLNAAFSLMTVQIASFVGIMYFTYLTGKKITHNKLFSFSVALLLVSIPSVHHWGHNLHPDIVMLFLLVVSIYFLINFNIKSLYIAAVFVGLATSTKYIGALYTIIIALIYINIYLMKYIRKESRLKNIKEFFFVSILLIITFLSSSLIPSWSMLLEFSEFLSDIKFELKHTAHGHGRKESASFVNWLPIIIKQTNYLVLVIPLAFLLILNALIFKHIKNFHKIKEDKINVTIALALFILFILCTSHLLISIDMRRPRYMFHIIPLVYTIVFFLYYFYNSFFYGRIGLILTKLITIFTLIFALMQVFINFQSQIKIIPRSLNNSKVEAGKLVEKYCKKNAKALVPQYSYVPSIIKKRTRGYSFNKNQILESEILILNNSVPGRHIWFDKKDKLTKGNYDISVNQYNLFKNLVFDSDDYKLVFKANHVRVYQKTISKNCNFPELKDL